MKKTYKNMTLALCALSLAFALTAPVYAQEISALSVPAGQKMNIEGVILSVDAEILTVRTFGNAVYRVSVSSGTDVKERKSNFLRGAKKYSAIDLVPGLQVEAKGLGMNSGVLAASEVRFRNDDHIVAQAMDTRVVPVEKDLRDTQVRLGATEKNAERLSGQIQELTAITDLVRNDARAAQTTADAAIAAAAGAQSTADNAHVGVRTTNERIGLIDDYEMTALATVYFKVGSAVIAAEYRTELNRFAEQIRSEKGYIIEVAGFASSDGDTNANRRLSQQRADAVIQHLAENYMIPMRRFVTPMGYGESNPVGDNKTREGREENRRVEVRLLINKGLTATGVDAGGAPVQTGQLR
ncbi:MAG: OmpA family protein [Acidobacteriota bacterium]|nr:OmpA family protein [Acidobacteriota bacterium]